jgi:hypothetical protein
MDLDQGVKANSDRITKSKTGKKTGGRLVAEIFRQNNVLADEMENGGCITIDRNEGYAKCNRFLTTGAEIWLASRWMLD